MKTLVSTFLLLATLVTAFAGSETPPDFKNLSTFLAWADKKLDADDHAALVAAQTDTTDSPASKLVYVKALDTQLAGKKLATVFQAREFPGDAETVKLGGHDKEPGHFHLDFRKHGHSWQLARIWQCR